MEELIVLFLASVWCGVPSFHSINAKQVNECRTAVVACTEKKSSPEIKACVLDIKIGAKQPHE